ncbi:MAG: hypothetical protein GYA21_16165 [Myxococcales bacterium]|nr:hypothetical protein [Myxococcales bacterium]
MDITKKILYCYNCNAPIVLIDKVVREDTCFTCNRDVRCCKNCRFWDPGAHNQCRENLTEYVPDRERANFCASFEPRVGLLSSSSDTASAKAKLEALFRK